MRRWAPCQAAQHTYGLCNGQRDQGGQVRMAPTEAGCLPWLPSEAQLPSHVRATQTTALISELQQPRNDTQWGITAALPCAVSCRSLGNTNRGEALLQRILQLCEANSNFTGAQHMTSRGAQATTAQPPAIACPQGSCSKLRCSPALGRSLSPPRTLVFCSQHGCHMSPREPQGQKDLAGAAPLQHGRCWHPVLGCSQPHQGDCAEAPPGSLTG